MESYPVLKNVFCTVFLLMRKMFFSFNSENPLKFHEFKSDNSKIRGSVIDYENSASTGSVINNKKETCAISAETNFKTKTNKPFPLNVGEKFGKTRKRTNPSHIDLSSSDSFHITTLRACTTS